MAMRNVWYVVVICVLACICMLQRHQLYSVEYDKKVDSVHVHVSDTVIRLDSVFFHVPTLVYVNGSDRKAVVIDTIDELNDTIYYEEKVYNDSTYTAWVSGFCCNLDSIEVYNKNTIVHDSTYINKVITINKKAKKWHFGPSVGVSFCGDRITPTIGFNVTYSVFDF